MERAQNNILLVQVFGFIVLLLSGFKLSHKPDLEYDLSLQNIKIDRSSNDKLFDSLGIQENRLDSLTLGYWEMPGIVLLTKDSKQAAYCGFGHDYIYGSVSFIEVRSISPDLINSSCFVSAVKSFKSNTGVHLGMNLEDFEASVTHEFTQRVTSGDSVIFQSCYYHEYDSLPYSDRIAYSHYYLFKQDQLIAYGFGNFQTTSYLQAVNKAMKVPFLSICDLYEMRGWSKKPCNE